MNSINKPLVYKNGWPELPSSPPAGMLAEVTKLRKRGVKISAEECRAGAVLCQVRLRRLSNEGMAYRSRCQMDMMDHRAISGGQAGTPLFDPYMEEWTAEGIIVSGWEITPGEPGEPSTQHYQAWLVKPVANPPKLP